MARVYNNGNSIKIAISNNVSKLPIYRREPFIQIANDIPQTVLTNGNISFNKLIETNSVQEYSRPPYDKMPFQFVPTDNKVLVAYEGEYEIIANINCVPNTTGQIQIMSNNIVINGTIETPNSGFAISRILRVYLPANSNISLGYFDNTNASLVLNNTNAFSNNATLTIQKVK